MLSCPAMAQGPTRLARGLAQCLPNYQQSVRHIVGHKVGVASRSSSIKNLQCRALGTAHQGLDSAGVHVASTW